MDKILQDSFAKSVNQFQLQFHHNIRGQGIVMLLLHFGFVLESLKSKEMFLPLIALTTSPKSLKVRIDLFDREKHVKNRVFSKCDLHFRFFF